MGDKVEDLEQRAFITNEDWCHSSGIVFTAERK
jgi:hypothetical protein